MAADEGRGVPVETVAAGAAYGALAWGAYGVVEVTAAVLLPIVVNDRQIVTTAHWLFSALTLGVYLSVGALLGGVLAMALARRRPVTTSSGFWRRLASACLVGVAGSYLVFNLLVLDTSRAPTVAAVAIGSLATILICVGLRARRATGLGGDPWSLATALVLLPIAFDRTRLSSAGMPSAVVVAALLAVAVLVAAAGRALFRRPDGGWRVVRLASAEALAIGLVVVLATAGQALRDPRRSLAPTPIQATPYPPVVIVVLDTVRAEHMSVYGYSRDTTPFLRELAAGASLYRGATATSNYTLPTHASLFTGLYPRTHGAVNPGGENLGGRALAPKFQTLAETLADHGVVSIGVATNTFYLPPEFGLHQGFDLWDARGITGAVPMWGWHFLRRAIVLGLGRIGAADWLLGVGRPGAGVTAGALALLDDAERRSSLLLFANYMDAHAPYVSRPRFTRRLRSADPPGRRPAADVDRYDAAIAYLDDQLRQLVEGLRARDLYDRSLIVVTSDHGEAFGEHEVVGHFDSLYHHQLRIPLIVKFPGQREGAIVDRMVSQVDIVPTVLDVLGIEAPVPLQGRSLATARATPRFVLAEGLRRRSAEGGEVFARQWALVSEDLKLISSSDGAVEAYDTIHDPHEERDLFDPDDPRCARALADLAGWLDATPLEAGPGESLDPALLRHLEAHGYLR